MRRTTFYSLFALFALLLHGCIRKTDTADLLVHNAKIYTLDEKNTIAQAMAIRDGKILEVGPEQQILNKYHSREKFNAAQKSIYPGFIDAHGHLLSYGSMLRQVDLTGTSSFDEVVKKVKVFAAKNQHKVIIGRGWDQNDWTEKVFPVNEKLNALFPDVPVLLYRVDGHAALANDKALRMAGVNENSTVAGGTFVTSGGKLTGVLIDNAISVVRNALPGDSKEDIEKALVLADQELLKYGITTVSDAGVDQPVVEVMKKLMAEKKMKLRVYAMMVPTSENLSYYAKNGIYKDDRLHIRSFKFMADGALGSWGACMKHPYHDGPYADHRGALTIDLHFLDEAVDLLNEIGFQANTHCIGDSANKAVLDIYAKYLVDMNGKRWRIEHAQVVDPLDVEKFRRYSILPSVQPTHALSDSRWAESRIGAERMKGAYAYQTLLQTNGMLALGTDFPVEQPDPLGTFFTAVFRKDRNGNPREGFYPEEALSRLEALKGMTIWAAWANFEDTEKGSLEAGKLADFVVMSEDIMQLPEKDLFRSYVLSTWINGEKVYAY